MGQVIKMKYQSNYQCSLCGEDFPSVPRYPYHAMAETDPKNKKQVHMVCCERWPGTVYPDIIDIRKYSQKQKVLLNIKTSLDRRKHNRKRKIFWNKFLKNIPMRPERIPTIIGYDIATKGKDKTVTIIK